MPNTIDRKDEAVLQDWEILACPYSSAYQAPEDRSSILHGKVYGHPRFTDGKEVYTSKIIQINEENCWAETQNTIYHLGKKSEDYLLFLSQYNNQV